MKMLGTAKCKNFAATNDHITIKYQVKVMHFT